MTITEFLLARIGEDETPIPWTTGHSEWCDEPPDDAVYEDDPTRCIGCGYEMTWTTHPKPARTLAECVAKRVIVELHVPWGFVYSGGEGCARCNSPDDYATMLLPDYEKFPCATLRAVAAIYADHADYQQEWRL